jgi:hypothetical protein
MVCGGWCVEDGLWGMVAGWSLEDGRWRMIRRSDSSFDRGVFSLFVVQVLVAGAETDTAGMEAGSSLAGSGC